MIPRTLIHPPPKSGNERECAILKRTHAARAGRVRRRSKVHRPWFRVVQNKLCLVVLALVLLSTPLSAQILVHDPGNAEIAVANHAEQILKLLDMIEEMQTLRTWLGNAAEILDLAGLDPVLSSSDSVGRSRVDLATSSTSAEAAAYSGDGLYQPVGESFTSRDGASVARPDVFKPEGAVFNAVRDHDSVYDDVMVRRQALIEGIEEAAAQLQSATSLVESKKATGVLVAQQAKLQAADSELAIATQKAILIDLQNRADKERQEKAAAQEQSRELVEALRHYGRALRPGTFLQSPQP